MKENRMKALKFANLLVSGLVICLAVTGCQQKNKYLTPIKGSGMTGVKSPSGGELTPGGGLRANEGGVKSEEIVGKEGGIKQGEPGHVGWGEDTGTLSGDTVHFAYDSSAIRGEDKSKLAAVADYLKANPANAVRIEGYCDERGTEEYNRSLGERRALALREDLILRQAIDPSRIDTISYGKDRPVDPGHDEASHAKNRRGVFVVLTPPAAK
jgi:peptidoglycan-associated lipoprotein